MRPMLKKLCLGPRGWIGMVILSALLAGCTHEAPISKLYPDVGRDESDSHWMMDWDERGAALYEINCASCHGFEGEGIADVYPALANNPIVTGPHAALVILPMYGRGAMPSFAEILSDEDMARVLSYVRESWGNRAGPVSPQQVAVFRQEAVVAPMDPILGGD